MRAGIAPCGAGIDSGLFDSSAGGAIILARFGGGQCLIGGTARILESLVDESGIGIESYGHTDKDLLG